MYNFDQCFIAKIKGVWTPVVGQIIESQGWKYLLCKHNGYPYWLNEGYERFDNGTPEETLHIAAVQYNTSDMNYKIQRENAERAEINAQRAGVVRQGWRPAQVLEQARVRAQAAVINSPEALLEAIHEARANRPVRRPNRLRRRR